MEVMFYRVGKRKLKVVVCKVLQVGSIVVEHIELGQLGSMAATGFELEVSSMANLDLGSFVGLALWGLAPLLDWCLVPRLSLPCGILHRLSTRLWIIPLLLYLIR